MNPDLLAYAADSLDAPARTEFERLLRDDPELRRQLSVVRRRLAVLDDEAVAPPAGLAENTLAFIARKTAVETPRPLLARPWWRRVDVLVAASIGVVALLLMLPAVQHLRGLSLQKECANNLRDLWAGLNAYQTQRHTLPDVASAPRPAAGMVIPMLRDAGVLPATLVACCPAALDPASATGAASLTHLTLHDFASMPAADFAKAAPGLLPGFAYSLGFRDEAGLHGPKTRLPDVAAAQLPLLADAPPLPAHSAANSPNHSARGQNVLFTDGHVAFKTLRTAGLPGDDIYLNQANQVAAGLGAHDIVLGNGGATP